MFSLCHRVFPLLIAALLPISVAAQSAVDTQFAGQWRLVGPFRAGWGTMAAGIADQPDTFYFGAAGGGVWKTTDAGATWQPMSRGLADASIGAIAIAPSNPKVIYAGSGQPEPRYDIAVRQRHLPIRRRRGQLDARGPDRDAPYRRHPRRREAC